MSELRLRNRARLRRKEVAALAERLVADWGVKDPPFPEDAAMDSAELEGRKVYLLAGEVVAFEHEDAVAPSVRGLLQWGASKRKVTVDMGAVRFVTNGADIMTPGITAAQDAVAESDLVWIAEERHGKPLAVGQALMAGPALASGSKGKGIKSLHFLGDKLWIVGHEEPAGAQP